MPPQKPDLLQGTLDLRILKTVAWVRSTGTRSHSVSSMSREVLQVQQGSLYPALYRLEERGYLKAEWRALLHLENFARHGGDAVRSRTRRSDPCHRLQNPEVERSLQEV